MSNNRRRLCQTFLNYTQNHEKISSVIARIYRPDVCLFKRRYRVEHFPGNQHGFARQYLYFDRFFLFGRYVELLFRKRVSIQPEPDGHILDFGLVIRRPSYLLHCYLSPWSRT